MEGYTLVPDWLFAFILVPASSLIGFAAGWIINLVRERRAGKRSPSRIDWI